MTADALAGDRMIGMVLLKPGFEDDYEGRPPIYTVGCTGLITHAERLDDGRYNVVLQGLERFRVREEDHARVYRVGVVERLGGDVPAAQEARGLRDLRDRIEQLLAPLAERAGTEASVPRAMADADLIHTLSQYLDLTPIEKQALLECETVLARAAALADLLEMRLMTGGASMPPVTH